jgi:hypothetical protein
VNEAQRARRRELEHLAAAEHLDVVHRVGVAEVGHGGEEPLVEAAPEHGGAEGHAARVVGQRVEAARDEPPERRRHGAPAQKGLVVVAERPRALRVAAEGAVGHGRAEVLGDEEGRAVGALEHGVAERVGGCRDGEHPRDHVSHVGGAEAFDGVALDGGVGREARERGVLFFAAPHGDHAERERRDVGVGEAPQRVAREVVGPLKIVEDQHEGPRRRDGAHDRHDRCEDALASPLGAELTGRPRARTDLHRGQLGRAPGELGDRDAEARLELVVGHSPTLVGDAEKERSERAQGRRVGVSIGAGVEAARDHEGLAVVRRLEELEREARLARSALSAEHHEGAAPEAGFGDGALKASHERLSPDEGRAVDVPGHAR